MSTMSALESSSRLYLILDIPNFSGADQVRIAYKSMALRYHPDKNIGDPSAVDRFREVQMAYEILSDEARKRRYDVALRIATRDGGGAAAGGIRATDNPYMRGMGTTGANFNANIYDELNRYAARAAKARTASAARTGVNKTGSGMGASSTSAAGAGGGGAGAGTGTYASADHTTSQYSRARQEEFRRRERERNAEIKKQREKDRRDQRDRDRETLRKEQARQEEQLQQQWQQQQKAFAATQTTRARGAAASTGATSAAAASPATPRTGRGPRSKTPPPPATSAAAAAAALGMDDGSSTQETSATPPPDTVPVHRSRPASAAPGQQHRGASVRSTTAAGPQQPRPRSTGDDDDARQPFSPRAVNPNVTELFFQTTSGASDGTASATTTTNNTANTRRTHTPGRPTTPRNGRNGAAADGATTPRSGAPGTSRSGGTPVRPNPLSNEDKELLGRQRSARTRQRPRAAQDTPEASAPSSAAPSPQPSMPRDEPDAEQHRLNRTKQKLERARSAKEAKLAASETLEQRLGYIIEDEAAERQQLIEREEMLSRQRMLRNYQTDAQKALLSGPKFVQLIREEAQRRAELERSLRASLDVQVLFYQETMDRLHVESLEGAVRRRMYGKRAADTYHIQRAHGQREMLSIEESRARKSLRHQESKQALWMLEVMGPEFFKRCLIQEDETFSRRRITLQAKKSEYVQQSPPRRSPSNVMTSPLPDDDDDDDDDNENGDESPTRPPAAAEKTASPDARRSLSSVPNFVVASRRYSATSTNSTSDATLEASVSHWLPDPASATPEERLAAEEMYNRYVLEQQEGHNYRTLLRHRANATHALYEADKAIALEAAQHAFDIQLRALRSEVTRLQQQQVRRSNTPSQRGELEDSVTAGPAPPAAAATLGMKPSQRRGSTGAAPHAPSPIRPTLTPPATAGGASPVVTKTNTVRISSPVPQQQQQQQQQQPSAPTSAPAVRASALAHQYLSSTGQRSGASVTSNRSPQRVAPASTSATPRSASRESHSSTGGRDRLVSKSSPVRKAS